MNSNPSQTENETSQAEEGKRPADWRRVIQPIEWWLLLVLVLYGIHRHQVLMTQTALQFQIMLGKEHVEDAAAVFLDGKPAISGQLISLGHHDLRITHPKTDAFQSRMFTWYGGNDFGTVHLRRSHGGLGISIKPAASYVQITGPEFQHTFTNTAGNLITVPTDDYLVRVSFPHWHEDRNVHAFLDTTNFVSIDPKFGGAELTCNQSNASFQVTKNGEILERGEFPATLTELPTGKYEVVAFHRGYQMHKAVDIRSSSTNSLACDFFYGTVRIETKPPGARVFSQDGHAWGTTPLSIPELPVGEWKFETKMDGFELASFTLQVTTNEQAVFSTNLVSFSYTGGMRSAREAIQNADYNRAMLLLDSALHEQPGDAAATSLRAQAEGLWDIGQADAAAREGRFTFAIGELNRALVLLPDNSRAKSMLEDYKVREAQQLRILAAARLTQGKGLLEAQAPQYKGWSYFDVNELSSAKKKGELHAAIRAAFGKSTGFAITKDQEVPPDCFHIEAVQKLTGAVGFVTGKRVCVVVVSQATDEQCQVVFKVLEYKAASFMNLGPADLAGVIDEHMVPVVAAQDGKTNEKLQARVKEGISLVTTLFQVAATQ